MKKRGSAKKPAWRSSAGILAGKLKITGDIVDTPDLWESMHLVDAIRCRVEPLGGLELPVVTRESVPEPPELDD